MICQSFLYTITTSFSESLFERLLFATVNHMSEQPNHRFDAAVEIHFVYRSAGKQIITTTIWLANCPGHAYTALTKTTLLGFDSVALIMLWEFRFVIHKFV